jgi:phosphoenolpyruvate---glycerone phosphotransferase subunit DhaL
MTITRDAILAWIRAYAASISEMKDALTRLDSDIGDGDHGTNMDRGFTAVIGKLADMADKDIGAIFKTVGMTLISTVGGASGPLYGTFFLQMATATGGKLELSAAEAAVALRAGVDGVAMRGKAQVGDKTMLDTLIPAIAELEKAVSGGADLAAGMAAASAAAEKGMLSTIDIIAKKGRASYLGERSLGHQDPGATSSFLLIAAASRALVA